MSRKSSEHQKRLDEMVAKPYLINQEDSVLRASNVYLGRANNLKGEIDWLGFDGHTITVIQYQCAGNNRERALKQLKRDKNYLRQYIPEFIAPIRTLYIHNDYKIEEVNV